MPQLQKCIHLNLQTTVWRALGFVTIQLHEVEICELKPKYKVKVTRCQGVSSTSLVELQR